MKPRSRIIPVFVPHLGCPHNCVFCNQRRISGSPRPASAEDVRRSIESCADVFPAQLAFYGGSFTAVPAPMQEELLGAVQPYIRDGRISSVRLSTRPDCIDEETLERLARFGVKTVELGSQSMCPEVLELSGRGHTAEDTRRAAAMVKAAGFELMLQMMTGLPGDSYERSMETARQLIELRPDGVRVYPTVIVRDTELYDMWQRGEYREHTVEEAVDWCSDILRLFEAAEIPVIRLGLNPTEELSAGGAAAGAYHPALGEMVYSRVYLKRARPLAWTYAGTDELVLGVHPAEVSKMVGQHRCNLDALQEEFSIARIKVRACPELERGGLCVLAR